VRFGGHAAGALDAAVFRLERAGMRLRLWAAERGARLDRFGAPPAAGAEAPAAILKVF
jgi:hypothetical protein